MDMMSVWSTYRNSSLRWRFGDVISTSTNPCCSKVPHLGGHEYIMLFPGGHCVVVTWSLVMSDKHCVALSQCCHQHFCCSLAQHLRVRWLRIPGSKHNDLGISLAIRINILHLYFDFFLFTTTVSFKHSAVSLYCHWVYWCYLPCLFTSLCVCSCFLLLLFISLWTETSLTKTSGTRTHAPGAPVTLIWCIIPIKPQIW